MNPSIHSLYKSCAILALLASVAAQSTFAQHATAADTSVVEESRRGETARAPTLEPHPGFRLNTEGIPIFGSQLFQGDFKDLSFSGFNPDYQINLGDEIQLMIWGALDNMLELTVDAQGNVFIPRVGPVSLLGVRNADLNRLINERVREVYRENVDVYANLRSTQTVKVFVSGFVRKPGLFEGFASDSVLYFLDRAEGIDPERGTYLDVSVLRRDQKVAEINLYEFLQRGTLPLTQFRDGDVILVGPRTNTATITGEVSNPARFEFQGERAPLDQLLKLASPRGTATSASIRRARSGLSQALVYPLTEAANLQIEPNDHVEITSRNVPETILVKIAGEHIGPTTIALPYGALLADAIDEIVSGPRSDLASLQLFRESVAKRQRTLLLQSLENLERAVLNARSSSLEEAQLRLAESEMIMAFIERARQAMPKGQVLLEGLQDADRIHLEDGDILFVPTKTMLVTVHGEVNFPNTQTFRERETLTAYIERVGGFAPNANKSELLVIRTNGAIDNVGRGRRIRLHPGDEIIVLPEPDKKTLQFAKDISQILYHTAISARVVIGL
jgi:protein involved in polysaccharide export with SLBB domain